ncbi:LacI family DNA-binding transcriptional regulator [Thermoanaerobacterium thermosaccharolyticum]|uniref:LacI family DNA-binding transcriptional regulator n=1 Tax=Thermoanaerobacterium thermosaccharolyticum TaxID=1517 RepID=UPI003DA8CEC2
MNVTIKDVAQRAHVAPSTVSRVIADNPRISKETKERVFKAMEELGYYPNAIARSLASKMTYTIGLIMPRSAEDAFSNPFFPEVMRGISVVAHNEKYDLLISTSGNEEEEKQAVINMVKGKRVDGIVLLCSRTTDELIPWLREEKFPFTVIGKPLDSKGVCWVDNDNIGASRLATNYLIKHGHREIAFISGSLEFVVSLDRLDGYKLALEENNIPFVKELVAQDEFSEDGGYNAMMRILKQKKPTAVVVTDDIMSFGVIRAAIDYGLKVPQDVSLIGFNNIPLSAYANPPLTTIDISTFELGVKSAELLLKILKNKDYIADHIIVPVKLIERKSCIKR